MTSRREPAQSAPVTAPVPRPAPAPAVVARTARSAPAARIPAYRWRMMVALAVVVSSGFLLGMIVTALR